MKCLSPGRGHHAARRRLAAFSLALLVGVSQVSQAATLTWNGGGTDNNWTTTGNWGAATIAAGDYLQFNGSTRLTSNNNLTANTNIIGLSFLSGAGAFTLTGNTILLGGDVMTTSTTNLQTINLGMNLSANRQFSVANGGLLIGAPISGNAAGRSVTKTGTGTMTLTAANTYSGATIIQQGLLVLSGADGALADGTGITITNGSTLRLDNGPLANNGARLFDSDAVILNGGTFNFNHTAGEANYAETAGVLTVSGGINQVLAAQAATGQTSVLTFSSLSRTNGVLNFGGTDLGLDGRNRITFTTAPNNNGIVGGFATVGNEFAAWDTTTLSVRSAQAADYLTTDEGTWSAAANVKLLASPSRLTADRQVNSLNLAPAGVLTLNLGGKTLRVESGGVLFSGASAAALEQGRLTAGEGAGVAGDVIVHQNSSALLTVGARITNNGAGAVGLTKAGTGAVLLMESAAFTGATTVLNGTLRLGVGGGVSATGALTLGDSSGTVATLDTTGTSQTVASLTGRSFSTNSTAVRVSPGETFTINGGITLGVDAINASTTVAFQGGGNLVVNNAGGTLQLGVATANNNYSNTTLDLSGLASATLNYGTTGSVVRVGDQNSTSVSGGTSTLRLAATTHLTVNRISLGGETGQGSNQTLTLGSVSSVINTDTLNAGSIGVGARGLGIINFATSTGTFRLRAANGTSAVPTMTVGASALGTTSGTLGGTVTLTGHEVDMLVTSLTVGSRSAGSGAFAATMSLDQGLLTATTVAVGQKLSTNTNTSTSTATFNIGGGVVSFGTLDLGRNATASGTVTATLNLTGSQQTTLGGLTFGTATTAGGTGTGTINLLGGTLTLNGAATRGGGAGTANANLTVNGGTLDMNGFDLGSGASPVTLTAQAGIMRDLGAINGTGGLTKTGTGTLELQGANTYSGPTVVSAGVLRISNVTDAGAAGNLGNTTADAANLVLNGGVLQYTGAGHSTNRSFGIGTTAGSAIEASGTGALEFTSSAATGYNAQTGTRTLTLTGASTAANLMAAAIGDNSGATSLVKSGAGTWVLTGTNAYTGSTTVSGGLLRLDFAGTGAPAANIVNSTSGLVMAGGALEVRGKAGGAATQTFAGLTVNAGASTVSTFLNGATSLTVTFGGSSITRTAGGTVNFVPGSANAFAATNNLNNSAGILGGFATLNGSDWASRDGSGNLVAFSSYTAMVATGGSTTTNYSQSGGNTLTGAVTFNSLKLSGTGTLAAGANAITFTGVSGGLLYAPALSTDGYSITGTAAVGAGTTSEFIVTVSQGTLSIANPVVSTTATAGSLTKAGDGALVLTGTNLYTGLTTVNAGVLEISGTGTIASGTGNIVVATGGTLRVNSTNAAQGIANNTDIALAGILEVRSSETIGGLSGAGVVRNGGTAAAVLTANSAGESSTFTGVFQNGGAGTLGLTKGGAGTLTLGGAGANTLSGPVVVNAGTLSLAKTGGALALSSDNITVGDGSGSTADILLLSGTEQIANTAVVTVSGNSTAAGAGVFRLNGNGETIGGLASTGAQNGIVENALANTTGVLTLGVVANQEFTGVLQNGTGTASLLSLVKTGAAQQTLSGATANTHTGLTSVLEGTLRLNKTAGVNAVAGALSVGDGSKPAVLLLAAANQVSDASLVTLGGQGLNAGVFRLAGNSETVAGLSSSTEGGGVVENESGVAGTATFGVNVAANTTQVFSGVLRDGDGLGTDGQLAFNKSGTGTQVLTGNNSHSGGTTISAGVLVVGAGGTTGSLGLGNVVNDGTLILSRSSDLELSQAITGTGQLILAGDGAVVLSSNANAWTGGTIVDQGVLRVMNTSGSATGSGFVTVARGAVLEGTGLIGGQVVINSGGTLSVGYVQPVFTVNSESSDGVGDGQVMTLQGGLYTAGTLAMDLWGNGGGTNPDANADILRATAGFYTLTGTLEVTANDISTWNMGDRWKLFDWSSLTVADRVVAFETYNLPTLSGGMSWDTSQLGTTGYLQIVPEPGRVVLLALGLALVVFRRQRAAWKGVNTGPGC